MSRFLQELWERMLKESTERHGLGGMPVEYNPNEDDRGSVPASLVPPIDVLSDDDELARLELIRLWSDYGGEG